MWTEAQKHVRRVSVSFSSLRSFSRLVLGLPFRRISPLSRVVVVVFVVLSRRVVTPWGRSSFLVVVVVVVVVVFVVVVGLTLTVLGEPESEFPPLKVPNANIRVRAPLSRREPPSALAHAHADYVLVVPAKEGLVVRVEEGLHAHRPAGRVHEVRGRRMVVESRGKAGETDRVLELDRGGRMLHGLDGGEGEGVGLVRSEGEA